MTANVPMSEAGTRRWDECGRSCQEHEDDKNYQDDGEDESALHIAD